MATGFPSDKSPGSNKRAYGAIHERRAEDYLQAQGLQPVTRNYQCKLGEIDLIMRQGNTLVFVEVRFRQRSQFGGAAVSVTRAKQAKLRRTALCYLHMKGLNEAHQSCRFDLVACDGDQINWIQNAF
ncbi:YraN family protein [Oceanimonas marisflavi]|uniref:YraN family protein n=1 Tax=Oceanimonas marisflavi TaxID=2059724 RepID=UPI000D327C2F|nr:YraN family protein [Oceanimonas marisflavi]